MWETPAMDAWIIFSTFLLGIGAGALSTAAINARQIRKLKESLSAANESLTTGKSYEPGLRKSA
jgi:hypothetical protein